MSRVRLLAAAAALAAAALAVGAAQAAAPSPGAGVFITKILREEIHGQWARQWRDLHPGHQKLITRAQYVACSRRMGTDFATGDEIFRVDDVRSEAIDVAGVPQRTSALVTITFHLPGKNGLTYRMHAVKVGSRWRWILGVRFLSAIARGKCLDGSPLQRTA
ncbi:MAG TPA: hypothetical protein VFA56_09720 [Gaiellaceae bacterium]|nr:hypothetical protein [Gaiellaceae bacterium]